MVRAVSFINSTGQSREPIKQYKKQLSVIPRMFPFAYSPSEPACASVSSTGWGY